MSFTEAQVTEIKNLINSQLYQSATNESSTDFTIQEKVSYALKLSLQKITTDAFATGKEWFAEPNIYNPIFKSQIYNRTIPSYANIRSDYIVVTIDSKKYITNIDVNNIVTNRGKYKLLDIITNSIVLPPSTPDVANSSYADSRIPIAGDFNTNGLLTKLPRSSWAFFKYWKAYLTGSKAKNNTSDSTPTGVTGTGTYPDISDKSSILTIISNTQNGNKTYNNISSNLELLNAFNDYQPLEIISKTIVDTYITENGSLDQINSDYSSTLLKNINNTIVLNLGVSTYSTWSGNPNVSNTSNSGYTDNMAFYNPLLFNSLSERYGYYSYNGGNGYYIISPTQTNITPSFGQGGNVKEGTMIFSGDTGFILFFGIGNVLTGVFNGFTSPISVSNPPIVTCLKYIGGTLSDGILPQAPLSLRPSPAVAQDKELFVDTDSNTIYRFDAGASEWISIGGGGGLWSSTDSNIFYQDGSVSIGKDQISSASNVLEISGNIQVDGLSVFSRGIQNFSDVRLKSDIMPIKDALSKIQSMNGVHYTMYGDRHVGLIAQDVLRVLPDAVQLHSNGYYTLEYANMVGLLVEGVKELKRENDELRSENHDIKERIRVLEETVGGLDGFSGNRNVVVDEFDGNVEGNN